MSDHFDKLETQEHAQRERELFAKLPDFLRKAIAAAPGWAHRLNGFDVASVVSRETLARIPVLRKPELMEAQAANPPFGGFADMSQLAGARYFMSPGPVWEPQATGADTWNSARAFHAAGIGPDDLVHNALSYHMTPGGFILDEGARAVGRKGVSGRRRQYRAAGGSRACAEADRLCRNAGLPQDHAGKGRRNRPGSFVDPKGAGVRRRAVSLAARGIPRSAAFRSCSATRRPTSA